MTLRSGLGSSSLIDDDDGLPQPMFDAGVALPLNEATKPVYTLAQIVTQLTTSWGGGDTNTRNWTTSSISFSLPDSAPTNSGSTPSEASGLEIMTAHEKATAELAFRLWDDLIPNTLAETTSAAADITFNYSTATQGDGTYTRAFGFVGPGTHDTITAQQVWIDGNWSTNQDAAVAPESYGNVTYIHEIGHALGLSHPGTYNAGSGGMITYANDAVYAQDNREYTVMSYFGGYDTASHTWTQDGTSANWLYPDTPMVDDIAALQALYGADTTTRTGDTTYGFHSTFAAGDPEKAVYDFTLNTHPILTIWDAGGNDTLDASGYSGPQSIDLTPGDYSSIDGMNGNIGIAFGAIIENAIGGPGNDTIIGNSADNVLRGDGGTDTIDGGAGTDSVVFSGLRAAYTLTALSGTGVDVIGPGVNDTLTNVEKLVFDDQTVNWPLPSVPGIQIVGGPGPDSLAGTDGNDTISGNGGDDNIVAGAGDDHISGGDGNDAIGGNAGNDTISGDAGNDQLGGDDGNDTIDGGDGNDTIWGGAGDDLLHGGTGDDIIVGMDGNDTILGDDGNDIANGGDGNDTMSGGAGNDIFGGGAGNDIITGDDGNDSIWGEDGNDNLNGGPGNDSVSGGAGDDQLGGGAGDDIVVGDDGNDTMWGEDGNDKMNGGAGNDVIFGGAGDDQLGGGSGDDQINGGTGNDTMWGESGADTFSFTAGDGNDTIADFAPGTDHIWFAATNLHSFADVQSHATTIAAGTLISYTGGSITLNGVSLAALHAGDFIFS